MSADDHSATQALLDLARKQGSIIERLIVDVSVLTTYVRRQRGFDHAEFRRIREASEIALAGLHRTGQMPSVELLIEILKADPGEPS